MLYSGLLPAGILLAGIASAQSSVAGSGGGPDVNGKYQIEAEGIRALFVPYGAGISNLFINDSSGVERDVVMGFDNATYYSIDRQHPHLGGVPGKVPLNLRFPTVFGTATDEETRSICESHQEFHLYH